MRMVLQSNNNVVYSCKYHVVWCPKYRRKVLVDGIDERLQAIIRSVVAERDAAVIEMEVMPDHVHLLVEVDPQFGIHRLVRLLKGRSSRLLRQEFPRLRSRLPTLWTNSYFLATVGGAPLAVIKQYIENHKEGLRVPRRLSARCRCLAAKFEAARQVYNACLGEGLRRLGLTGAVVAGYSGGLPAEGRGQTAGGHGPADVPVGRGGEVGGGYGPGGG